MARGGMQSSYSLGKSIVRQAAARKRKIDGRAVAQKGWIRRARAWMLPLGRRRIGPEDGWRQRTGRRHECLSRRLCWEWLVRLIHHLPIMPNQIGIAALQFPRL